MSFKVSPDRKAAVAEWTPKRLLACVAPAVANEVSLGPEGLEALRAGEGANLRQALWPRGAIDQH